MPLHLTRRAALLATLLTAAGAAHAGLVETIVAAKPSVLAVGTHDALDNPRFTFRGSGFVVGDGNLLVTNAHVLPDDGADSGNRRKTLAVVAPRVGSGEVRTASVVRIDRTHDLALLRFEGSPLAALRLAEPKNIHEGASIALMGFPIGSVLGLAPVTHRGIISSITAIALPPANARQLNERSVRALRDGAFELYQLDATAYPGNSGGPVLDADSGEVVGVVNMVLVRSTKESALSNPTGISYAIPARFVRELIEQPR
ncbi:S1 family peptidase [Piscinibacter koreensis]|uniref:Trypsin-like peptidase domain-containing protein n=1 Tax=Piscinibacter koreensis TaxID=2742824 RepID=A0A7Y6NK15_9BURK|nr:serine protease [Schlegelella koreensis]NUZ04539.1 trypsin-like peptidase domain-containing protein [Schlegelella koreensis]